MSAVQLTDAVVKCLSEGVRSPSDTPDPSPKERGAEQSELPDFVCLNYPNADMVGHTGVFSAVVKAVETVDACVKRVVEAGTAKGYSFLITADHGNSDFMINADGSPNTAHTTNPVPLFLVNSDYKKLADGRLSDLAPTILTLMGIDVPKEMTGKTLVS
jgi:2,3-bisphosphoglycerate-independent phosphoglycerate mutase